MIKKKVLDQNIIRIWIPLLLFIGITFLLYYPTLNRSFASDDFLVLSRIGLKKKILIRGFFRPLSDISLYINFIVGGFNPLGYYLFGVFLHALNGFLLFQFCLRWHWSSIKIIQYKYALLASLLFIVYPFHNESIVWVLGRASSMANTFGILALVIAVSNLPTNLKISFACICYFIGLTSYESILVLPAMLIVIIYEKSQKTKYYLKWVSMLTITLILHLTMRVWLSGVIAGSYGESFFGVNLIHYFGNIFKVFGRIFLPPIQNSSVFVSLLLLLIFSFVILAQTAIRRAPNSEYLLRIVLLICISSVIPVLFGVSTKTSESDRFLHLPSFFVCALISFLLISLTTDFKKTMVAFTLIFIYFLIFLKRNNSNWIRASDITKEIIEKIRLGGKAHKLILINIPDEYNGAYIFRLGLKEALAINSIKYPNLIIINHLKWEEMLRLPLVVEAIQDSGYTNIPPVVKIQEIKLIADSVWVLNNKIYLNPGAGNVLFYWNNSELIQL